jgi:hypothetical protein
MYDLFLLTINFLKEKFEWSVTSAYTQENKPKFKLSTFNSLNEKPNVTVIPYKKHIQIRTNAGFGGDEQLKESGFKYAEYKNAKGDSLPYFAKDITSSTDIEKLNGISIHNYFLPLNVETQMATQPDYVEDLHSIAGLTAPEKNAIAKVRLGQGSFRKKLVEKWGKCMLTKCPDKEFLIASHIKPWHKCKPGEHLDTNNGLLLSVHMDALFDKGYISFDVNGQIMISEYLNQNVATIMGVRPHMKIELSLEAESYMSYHRDNVFILKYQ